MWRKVNSWYLGRRVPMKRSEQWPKKVACFWDRTPLKFTDTNPGLEKSLEWKDLNPSRQLRRKGVDLGIPLLLGSGGGVFWLSGQFITTCSRRLVTPNGGLVGGPIPPKMAETFRLRIYFINCPDWLSSACARSHVVIFPTRKWWCSDPLPSLFCVTFVRVASGKMIVFGWQPCWWAIRIPTTHLLLWWCGNHLKCCWEWGGTCVQQRENCSFRDQYHGRFIQTSNCSFSRADSLGTSAWKANPTTSGANKSMIKQKSETQTTARLGGGFIFFYFSPLFGEDFQFD